ncbi:MAG TPA: SpoIID/LytB domain-containing protein, partial [Ilumatobacter sp.]
MRALVAVMLGVLLLPWAGPSSPVAAAPTDDEVIAFVVSGVGLGHGRGLSQWGAYGRAMDGQSWQQIVDAYYGGTQAAERTQANLRVRLLEWRGAATVGVVSHTGTARWNTSPTDYTSLYATETAPNRFDVYGLASQVACPGPLILPIPAVDLALGDSGTAVRQMQQFLTYFGYDPKGVDGTFGPLTQTALQRFESDAGIPVDGFWSAGVDAPAASAMVAAESASGPSWQLLEANVVGPVRFSTTVDARTAQPGDVLGACRSGGSIRHYRGVLELRHESAGNELVNELDIEHYLRGVVPKEVSTRWGGDGGGKGMNALRAQSVAARSYALAQRNYTYAETCDSSACQVYGGAASRVSPDAAPVPVEQAYTDRAIADTARSVRIWPGTGSIALTEFSSSNGPRTAGGKRTPEGYSFAAVDDPWDDVAGNSYHEWTRIIDADAIIAKYQLSSAALVATVADTDSPYDGIWANEVTLGRGAPVSAWTFRNDFGLPSPGFTLTPVRRTQTAAGSFALIGDSVGEGVAGGAGSNLQVLTDGVFTSARFEALTGRRTVGGTVPDGVSIARTVPVGTDLVVVELGYNDDPSAMASRIDSMMTVLRQREVAVVAWVNLSERRSQYRTTNAALQAAGSRWSELVVLDWESASDSAAADRWFRDGVHLTSTGNAEFASFLREHILTLLAGGSLAGSGYGALSPVRLFESRSGYATVDGVQQGVGRLVGGVPVEVVVGGRG